jgi:hypothetical protein
MNLPLVERDAVMLQACGCCLQSSKLCRDKESGSRSSNSRGRWQRCSSGARNIQLRLSHSIEPMLVRTCISVAALWSFFKLVGELEEERISPGFRK